jgi:O-antigen/teichoic acid export membrane protein
MFYSAEIAGLYSLTHRALTTPARLLGNSVRQVYFQRASKIFNKNESIRKILSKSTIGLVKVSIIPFLIIGIFAQSIFIFVFGKEWLVSGIYAQLIIIYIFALTINPPSVMTLQILGMQKFSMVYEIFLAIFRFLAIYLGYLFYNNHFVSISMFSIVGVIFNIFLITYIFRKVKRIELMT